MGFFKKLVSESDAKYSIREKDIICTHCGHDSFFIQEEVLLNTRGLTFFNLDWANKSATVLICSNCTKMEWFLSSPSKRN